MASSIVYLDESPLAAEKYNALPHIDNNKDLAICHEAGRNKLLNLISFHKLQGIFSIHLVHKHFDLSENRVMVYEMVKGTSGYPDFQISSPRFPSTCENLHGVYFTAAAGGRMVAYEYTTDPLVNISSHNDFFREFSNLVVELGLENVYALTVKYYTGPPLMHEFEMPDLGSTVLVPNSFWIPGGEGSVSTDWGFGAPAEGFQEAAVLTRCTVTRSNKHYEITKYEPDDSKATESFQEAAVLTRCTVTRSNKHYEITKYEPDDSKVQEGGIGKINALTRCIETSSGMHHERPKVKEDLDKAEFEGLMINGELLLPGSEVFSIVTHARQIICAF